jgi:hypothetical protein
LGILEALKHRGTTPKCLRGERRGLDFDDFREENKGHSNATMAISFLTGTNVLTEDGRLVNVDAFAIESSMFWASSFIIVVGKNKIVKNLDEA